MAMREGHFLGDYDTLVEGVVHAYVDQKLLQSNKIKSFNPGPKIGSRHCSNEYKRTNITTLAFAIMSLRPPQYNIYLS